MQAAALALCRTFADIGNTELSILGDFCTVKQLATVIDTPIACLSFVTAL